MKWILKTRVFSRWMRKALLSDDALWKAIQEMETGLVDADLGGGLFKKRIALPGGGKRGGARTVIATNQNNRWIFIFGFGNNERDNITRAELTYMQSIAHDLLGCPESKLQVAIRSVELQEVRHEPDH